MNRLQAIVFCVSLISILRQSSIAADLPVADLHFSQHQKTYSPLLAVTNSHLFNSQQTDLQQTYSRHILSGFFTLAQNVFPPSIIVQHSTPDNLDRALQHCIQQRKSSPHFRKHDLWQQSSVVYGLKTTADTLLKHSPSALTHPTHPILVKQNTSVQLSPPPFAPTHSIAQVNSTRFVASNQSTLRRTIEIINLLQQAEIDNFFREACLEVQPIEVEKIDPEAAVFYTLLLPDRLEVILSLPEQPLKHYRTDISLETLETTIDNLRQGLVIRSRRVYLEPGQKLYDWLIKPALTDLEHSKIETLVFVLDGSLRNIPMAALYSGQQFLVEQYGLALTPSPQILMPQPLAERGIKTLSAGLTQAREQFPSLAYVGQELDTIHTQVEGYSLRDRHFTRQNLAQKMLKNDFSVVHIATHGQFSSHEEDTFLLAWDGPISIRQLADMIYTQQQTQRNPIELLILSACETAAGNKRAALGLAGMAVRAGARSTLASLWAINDESTAALMQEFYRALNQPDIPKSKALQQAQIALLRNPRYRHPFYWSSFVLLGNWL